LRPLRYQPKPLKRDWRNFVRYLKIIMQEYGSSTTFSALGDGKFLLTSWRLGDPHPDSRCAGIIIGNVGIEGIVFDALTLLLPQTIFNKGVLSAFKRASDAELFCKKN
jgi:hypothetical protein